MSHRSVRRSHFWRYFVTSTVTKRDWVRRKPWKRTRLGKRYRKCPQILKWLVGINSTTSNLDIYHKEYFFTKKTENCMAESFWKDCCSANDVGSHINFLRSYVFMCCKLETYWKLCPDCCEWSLPNNSLDGLPLFMFYEVQYDVISNVLSMNQMRPSSVQIWKEQTQ